MKEYKKAIEITDKKLSGIEGTPRGQIKVTILSNTELKKYIENIKQRYQTVSKKQQQQEYFDREKEYFRQKQPKKYKKVIYKEESDSEPEIEEGQYVHKEEEDIEEEKKEVKQLPQKRKNKIFNYLNKDAKRNKQ